VSADTTQIGISWLISLVVGAAAGSGVISAIVSHRLTMREFSKKTDLEFIRDKMDLYAKLIHDLNDMKYRYDAMLSAKGQTPTKVGFLYEMPEWPGIRNKIDSRISEYPLLLTPKIHEKWVWVKSTPAHPQSELAITEMRSMLIKEYNDIHDKYLRRIKDIVPRIPADKISTPE
jgi:hypothetical protein